MGWVCARSVELYERGRKRIISNGIRLFLRLHLIRLLSITSPTSQLSTYHPTQYTPLPPPLTPTATDNEMPTTLSGAYTITHSLYPTVVLCSTHAAMENMELGEITWTVAAVTGEDPDVYTLEMTIAIDSAPVALRFDRFGFQSDDETRPGLQRPVDAPHYNQQDWVIQSGDPELVPPLCACVGRPRLT